VSVMVERLQKQEAEAHLAQFDRLIEGLGEEYGDALGKGPTADLDEKTDHFRMRKKLIESIRRLAIGYGDVAPGMGDLFRRAVAIEFADKQKKLVTSNLSKKLRDRKSGQFLSKPTQHKERAKTGEPTVEDIKREWEARTRAEGLTV